MGEYSGGGGGGSQIPEASVQPWVMLQHHWVGKGLEERTDGLANWKIDQRQREYLNKNDGHC